MPSLSEAELERLQEAVCAAAHMERSAFLDNLIARTLQRYPPLQDALEPADGPPEAEGPGPTTPLSSLPGGFEEAVAFAADALGRAAESPYFPLVRAVADRDDSQAFERLMEMLDSALRIRGIFFRHRLDPEQEVPGIWGRIWEAIPKWDGRDFRAYVARIVRNYCLDEIQRRKKTPATIDDEPGDPRPRVRSAQLPAQHDAMAFLREVLDELEAAGRIKALDAVMFGLVCRGEAVADVLETLAGPAPPRVAAAAEALGVRRALGASEAALLGFLLDGLSASEASALAGRGEGEVAPAAEQLAGLEGEQLELARFLARDGMTLADLGRASRLTPNALNLCMNRIRLKVWMGLMDRAYESLRRRGRIDPVDLAIVQNRCTAPTRAGCRMYKDRTCKREADADEMARRAGLDLSGAALGERMDDLRRKILEEGLALSFPDYNACLNERRSPRAGSGS